MSYYISEQGLIDRYGEDLIARLSDRDSDQDSDVTPTLRAITDAEGEINSYLGKQYDLPLPGVVDVLEPEVNSSVPDVLRRVAADIAIYRLAPSHDMLTREQRKRYDDAVKWLERVASGEVSLGVEAPTPTQGGGLQITSNPRIFTRDSTDGLV